MPGPGHADATWRRVIASKCVAIPAVTALFVAQPLRRASTHRDADVQRCDRRGSPGCRSSCTQPRACWACAGNIQLSSTPSATWPPRRQSLRSHRADHDARRGRQELAQLGHRVAYRLQRGTQPTGPDPDPQLRRVQSQAIDLRHDLRRRVPVDGEDADSEIELGRSRRKMSELSSPVRLGSSFAHSES